MALNVSVNNQHVPSYEYANMDEMAALQGSADFIICSTFSFFSLFEFKLPCLAKVNAMLRLKSSFQKKPYTAVTVQVDRLTGEQYEGDDMTGIVDLIEVIRLQAEGPTEAARAIRKKL